MPEIRGAATEKTLRRVATLMGSEIDPINGEIRGAATEETLLRIEAALGGSGGGGLREYVEDWLDAHPEATTRIEDGSITAQKLNVTVTYTVDSNGNLTIALE